MRGTVNYKLSEILGRHRLKQRELARAAGIRPAAINALYHGNRERLDLAQLASILDALEDLTGQRYDIGDLIEYQRNGTEKQE